MAGPAAGAAGGDRLGVALAAPVLPTGVLVGSAAIAAVTAGGLLVRYRGRRSAVVGVLVGLLAALTVAGTGGRSGRRCGPRPRWPTSPRGTPSSRWSCRSTTIRDRWPAPAAAGARRGQRHPGRRPAGGRRPGAGVRAGAGLVRVAARPVGAAPGGGACGRAGDDVAGRAVARGHRRCRSPTRAGCSGRRAPCATGWRRSARRVLAQPARQGCCPGWSSATPAGLDPVLHGDSGVAGLTHLTAVSRRRTWRSWSAARAAAPRGPAAVAAGAGRRSPCSRWRVRGARPPEPERAAGGGDGRGSRCVALASGRARAGVPALAAAVVALLLGRTGAGQRRRVRAVGGRRPPRSCCWRRAGRGAAAATGARPLADALAVSAAAPAWSTAPRGGRALRAWSASSRCRPTCSPRRPSPGDRARPAGGAGRRRSWLGSAPTSWPGSPAGRCAGWCWSPSGRLACRRCGAGLAGGGSGALLLAVLLAGACLARCWRWPRLRPLALAARARVAGARLAGAAGESAAGRRPDGRSSPATSARATRWSLPAGPATAVLVDAGPDGALGRPVPGPAGRHRLPLVLLSHLDADHVGGLAGALHRPAGRPRWPPARCADRRPGRRAGAGRRRRGGGHVVLAARGAARASARARVEVLAPDPQWRHGTRGAERPVAWCVRATVRGVRMLFTGDLGAEAQSAHPRRRHRPARRRAQGAAPRQRRRRPGVPRRQRRARSP